MGREKNLAYLSSVTLQDTIFSIPHADNTFTITVLPSSNCLSISSTHFLSSSVGSPVLTKVGRFKSSLVPPSSRRRLTSPDSASAFRSWYSVFLTTGTLKLWDVGHKSSYFFPVNISSATICALACPCFPVLDVETSAHLHGCPLIIKYDPFLISPACWGYVWEAPASAVSKVGSSSAMATADRMS